MSEYSSDKERLKNDIKDVIEPDFTSQPFLWGLYLRYVEEYIERCKYYGYKTKNMLKPGLFCEYLSIRTLQAVRGLSMPFNLDTISTIISDELVKPEVIFQPHPAGPIGYISIFEDVDGDHPPILGWK